MTDSELRLRWKTPEGAARRSGIREWLAKGGRPPRGVETHGGRIDLRGIELVGLERSPVDHGLRNSSRERIVSGVEWRRIDFSGANLQHLRLFSAVIEDCLFEDSPCDDLRMWDTTVVDSSFARARMSDSAIGTWHEGKHNTWRNVSFDAADLRNASAEACELIGVSFRDTQLGGIDFSQSTIVDCVFAGRMRNVLFDGRVLPRRASPSPLRRVDFRDAIFDEVEFRGCQFEDVTLPTQPGIRLIHNFPRVARHVIEEATKIPSDDARLLASTLEYLLRSPGIDGSTWVFNRSDYVSEGGAGYADLADDMFSRAEAAVQR